jgi:predicted nucleic acid-binding protein
MNAVDTNVFVYLYDNNEIAKQIQARELIDRLVRPPVETVLLWQVAAELLSCLRRWQSTHRIGAAEVETSFRRVLSVFPLVTPSARVLEISFNLQLRWSLSHWDSMLLAACKEAGVTTLFSEDLDAGTDYDGLAVVNPFT